MILKTGTLRGGLSWSHHALTTVALRMECTAAASQPLPGILTWHFSAILPQVQR
jgi:hypothetical protein